MGVSPNVMQILQEISDNLANMLAALASEPLQKGADIATSKAHVTYIFPGLLKEEDGTERAVTLLENRYLLAASGTTGRRTWEAAIHLARYLSSDTGLRHVHGKRVMELGAGTGLVSILAVKHLNAERGWATDGSDEVVDALTENALLNGVSLDALSTVKLSWGQDDQTLEASRIDTVIGADIVGEPTTQA